MTRAHIHSNRRMKRQLFTAVRNGCYDAASNCLLDGVPVNSRDSSGKTPLIWAAIRGDEEILSLLMGEKNIRLDDEDDEGFTALARAAAHGKSVSMQMLLERGANPYTLTNMASNLLLLAVISGCPEAVQVVLPLNISINASNVYDEIPLHMSLRDTTLRIPKMLLAHGADVNIRLDDYFTPLMFVSLRSSWTTIKLFLDHGASINERDYDGETALMKASKHNLHHIIVRLIERGANW
eukprot:CAMPEP_0184699054 /NCGR_PEP_ID=MMETSP0313-20130426/5459_1 /TAXON_ID=2792 /ORGANISM="Porphyridium aerugineum, Strain SAG 1380-2" /LENGTH=237 /DNA_ID=CAMNT_0027158079 /DNA_START=70 /DNA_END=780 /DNA_ORIENTATION=+